MMASAAKTKGKDLSEFRANHDKAFIVPRKIEEGLKLLGPDKWDYQGDFVKLCQISVMDLAMFRENYTDFIVEIVGKTRKSVWCGSKALAAKMRAMV